MNTRTSTGTIRETHICAECGKSFRSGQDLRMHAEICMLDALETANVATSHQQHGISVVSEDFQDRVIIPGHEVYTKPAVKDSAEFGHASIAANGVSFERILVRGGVDQTSTRKPKRQSSTTGRNWRPKMQCPKCGIVLYRHNFAAHHRIHTGELPFSCSVCEKRFRTSSALTVHLRCHTGERPYECPCCVYSCITKRNLDRHIVNNHVKKTNSANGVLPMNHKSRDHPHSTIRLLEKDAYGNVTCDKELAKHIVKDIEDENLDDDELEEEANLWKIGEHQDQQDSNNEESNGATEQASYEPVYKRIRSMPFFEGPKGVYGDPEWT